jgi:WD40 repeat protein
MVAALAAGRVGVLTKAGLATGLLVVFGGVGLLVLPRPADPPTPATAALPIDPQLRKDLHGDPLPPGAIARMGTVRWRHRGAPRLVVPSPTGKLVAVSGTGQRFGVFNLDDGRLLCEIPWDKHSVGATQFTPDGSRLMFTGERGVVRFFDAATGKAAVETAPVVEKDVTREEGGRREAETFHYLTKDGRWVATSHPAGDGIELFLTGLTTDRVTKPRRVPLEPPPGFGKAVELYEYTCVGNTAIAAGRESGGGRRGPVVFRWELATGKLTKATRIDIAENYFDLSPDGERLLTWAQGGTAAVWDANTGKEAFKLDVHGAIEHTVRFSPDGKRLVAAVYDPADPRHAMATVWELERGTVAGRLRLPKQYNNPFLLPDGRTLLAADYGLMIATWDVASGHRISPTAGHETGLGQLEFSADGATLYTASHQTDEQIIAWEAATGKKLRDLAAPSGYSGFVFTPDGGVVSGTSEGTLIWADRATGRELRRVRPGPLITELGGPIWGVTLFACPDSRNGRPGVFGLVRAEKGGKILAALWDATTGELLARRPFAGDRSNVAVSPDGRLLARNVINLPPGVSIADAANCMAVVVEDTRTGAGVMRINQPDCLQRNSTCFTPDGHSLVTWTTAYPRGRNAWAPAGTTTIRLWEVRTGKQRLAFALPVVGDHWADEPEASAISADGRRLAGARPDKSISVWDLTTGAEVATRSGYRFPPGCLAFRSDGKALASGHDDGTAVVWDLPGLPSAKPVATDREVAWKDMASDDAGKAYRAVLALASDPGCAGFLRDRVKPAAAIPAGAITRLVGDLDSAAFATRERATEALARLGDAAGADLRAALRGDVTAEQRRRIEGVLAKWGLTESDPDRLRALRCVEVLERSGSADARELLGGLANGAAGARLTREAGHAIRHLTPQP